MGDIQHLPRSPDRHGVAMPSRVMRLAAANDNHPPYQRLVGWLIVAAAAVAGVIVGILITTWG